MHVMAEDQTMSLPIKLRAQDAEDLRVVSACLQDAIVPIGEMCFLPTEARFVLIVNRFKWETAEGGRPVAGPTAEDEDLYPFERTHCAVRFDNITAARTRGIDLKSRGQILELLSLEEDDGGIVLHFAGGGCIRLDGAGWRCVLEDLGEPWPTASCPCHPLDATLEVPVDIEKRTGA